MKQLEQLLEITSFSIDGEEYDASLIQEAIQLTGNLTDDFANQAKYVAIIGYAYEHALRHEARLESQLKRVYALVDARTRGMAKTENFKTTEKQIEGIVITSQEYQAKENELIEARFVAGLLKTAKDALQHKKDALVGSAANYRAEVAAEATMIRK